MASLIGPLAVTPQTTSEAFRDGYARDNGQSGMLFPTAQGMSVTALRSLTANQGYWLRGVPSRNLTVVGVRFVLTTISTGDDAVDGGIYDASGTRIVSAGATTGKLNGATGTKTITIAATTLTAGTVYYAAFSVGTITGGSPAVLGANFQTAFAPDVFGGSVGLSEAFHKGTSHVLPASIGTPTFGGAASYPALWLVEA